MSRASSSSCPSAWKRASPGRSSNRAKCLRPPSKWTPPVLSNFAIRSRYAAAFTGSLSNSTGTASTSNDSSSGCTDSTVKGPLTRIRFFCTAGRSTSSSIFADAAMQSLTSFILAFHAFRNAVTAFCNACGQSGSVSNGTSHSSHAVSGKSHRRRSASVTSRFFFCCNFSLSCFLSAGVTLFRAALTLASFLAIIGSCFSKMASSATLFAMLFRSICGTVPNNNPLLIPIDSSLSL